MGEDLATGFESHLHYLMRSEGYSLIHGEGCDQLVPFLLSSLLAWPAIVEVIVLVLG
jgi:hypothetical protein